MPTEKLLPALAEELSKRAYRKALPAIRSRQLKAGLQRVQRGGASWALHIPHFWAVYLNDGRSAVTPKNATYLVWFRNPKDDPRLVNGNTPERLSQTRRLSSAQFKYWAGKNREIIKRYRRATGKRILTRSDYEAMKLPMVVVKMSPRTGLPVEGQHFFDNVPGGGMYGFMREAGDLAKQYTSGFVLGALRKRGLTGSGGSQKKKKVVVRF